MIAAIVQARMGSTRLPGKVLADLGGATVLARTVRRAARSSHVERTVVATTTLPRDDAIVAECEGLGVDVFRGDEEDVLDRYHGAAADLGAGIIVRVTSDCPLIDPGVMDRVIGAFLDERPDYAANTLSRSYPRGLDTEVMTFEALERAWREAKEPHERAHVTPYIHSRPEEFTLLSVTNDTDESAFRWTVDTPEDLELVRAIYARLGNDDTFPWEAVLEVVRSEPALVEMNRHVRQKSLHEG